MEHNYRGGKNSHAAAQRRNVAPLRRRVRILAAITFVAFLGFATTQANANQLPVLSILDFGSTTIAKQATDTLRNNLRATGAVTLADADLSRAAAKGIGYSGSLNLTVSEARDLGAALAAEFYILGDAQTLRRSSFESPIYFESYCSIFLVSARTGRLLLWERPSFENDQATKAEARLSQYLSDDLLSRRLIDVIKKAHEDERIQRTVLTASAEAVIEEAPEDEKAAEVQGIRTPQPYRRLRPEYPQSAARADAGDTAFKLGFRGGHGRRDDRLAAVRCAIRGALANASAAGGDGVACWDLSC